MIKVKDLKKSFGEQEILKGINLEFSQGKCNMIIGQSGAGKTVLLKSLLGLHTPDSGSILFDNADLVRMNRQEKKELRKQFGMVFQGSALFDSMSIEENLMFPLRMFSSATKEEQLHIANRCLERVNLENVNAKYPAEISGGMQKRVAIARAIVLEPKYLFCDEPNSGLDPKTAILIDDLLLKLTEELNMTTVINSHDMNSVMQIGENIAFIDKGNVSWTGNKADIFSDKINDTLESFIFSSKLFQSIRKAQSSSL